MVVYTSPFYLGSRDSFLYSLSRTVSFELISNVTSRVFSDGHYKLNTKTVVTDFWRDCDGGGWLKKHLDSARMKIQAVTEGAKGLVPQPAPVPIPVAAYTVSAEASYQRAMSVESISKGVLLSLEAGALALVGFALTRGAPMSGATAGFGITTDNSSFSSVQNHVF